MKNKFVIVTISTKNKQSEISFYDILIIEYKVVKNGKRHMKKEKIYSPCHCDNCCSITVGRFYFKVC